VGHGGEASIVTSELESLRDEIALRQASIADARAERDAGELTEAQFTELEARELVSIEHASAALETLEANFPITPAVEAATSPPTRPARRHRRGYLIIALVSFTLAAIVAVVLAVQPRQPGNSDTGSVGGSIAERVHRLLAQGEIDEAVGSTASALAAFNQALALDPRNVEALTQSGWLYFSAGSASKDLALIKRGEESLNRAAALAPTNPAPRLYLGIAAASTPGSRAAAVAQFREFIALHPSAQLLALARPWLIELGLATG
jgi:tetratricopeptide (TPR) repeat protein